MLSSDDVKQLYGTYGQSNNHTERNAYIIQYIWKIIDNLAHTKNTNIKLDEFTSEIRNSDWYNYLTDETKKRVLKRMHYVWISLRKALPDIVMLDDGEFNGFHDAFIKGNTSLSESISDMDKLDIPITDPIVHAITSKLSNGRIHIESGITPYDKIRIDHYITHRKGIHILELSRFSMLECDLDKIISRLRYTETNDSISITANSTDNKLMEALNLMYPNRKIIQYDSSTDR